MPDTIIVQLAGNNEIKMNREELAQRLAFAKEALEMDSFVRTVIYRAFLGIDDHDLVIGANTDPQGKRGAYIVETSDLPKRRLFEAMSPAEYNSFVKEFPQDVYPARAYLLNNPQLFGKDMLEECKHIVKEHMLGGKAEVKKAEYLNWSDKISIPPGTDLKHPTIDDIVGWAQIHSHSLWANRRAETFYKLLKQYFYIVSY